MSKKKKNIDVEELGSKSELLNERVARYGAFNDDIRHDRSLWFIIYFGIVLAYLLLNQGGSLDLAKSPQWAFRAFAFGGLIIFGILDSKRIRENLSRINLFSVLPISLLIILVSSNIVSIRPFETVEETMNVLAYASLAFLTYIYIDNLQRLRQFVEVIIAAGFLIAFHGLYIFYGALWSRGETTPLSSLFYWHNPCAGFLLLTWPVMLAQFYSLRRGWHVFLILYMFFITFTAFGLTLSRGGWLAGMIPFLGIPFFLSRKKTMVGWRPIVLIVMYFLSAIPFVLKYRGRFFQPIIDRFNQIRWDDYSVVGRFEFWQIAVKVYKEHPIFGIGFNTFGYYYVHYQSNPQYYTKDPHSLVLQFLVEGGVFGVIFLISFLAIVFNLVSRTLKTGTGTMLAVYRVGLLMGIIGALFHNAIDFDWTFPVIQVLIVCELAVVARTFTFAKVEQELPITQWEPDLIKDAGEDSEQAVGLKKSPTRGFFIRRPWVWLTIALILFCMNIMGYVSMRYYEIGKDFVYNRAQMARDQAEEQMGQLEKEAVRSQTQEDQTFDDFFAEAFTELGQKGKQYWLRSLKYNPWNWYPLNDLMTRNYFVGSNMVDSGMNDDAIAALREGLSYSDRLLNITPHRAASRYYVGMSQITLARLTGDDPLKQKGLANILMSIELDPKNIPQYYLGIAQYYFDEGDFETSYGYLEKIEEIYVPKYDTGGIDFNGLKGKSGARLDWRTITETMRDAWALKATILLKQGRMEEALMALGNGLDTPMGTGEVEQAQTTMQLSREEIEQLNEEYGDDEDAKNEKKRERQVDIYYKQIRLPFFLIIAEVEKETGDWVAVKQRASQAKAIIEDLKIDDFSEMDKLDALISEADSHLLDMQANDSTTETWDAGDIGSADENSL